MQGLGGAGQVQGAAQTKSGTLAGKVGDLGSHSPRPWARHFDFVGLSLDLGDWMVHKARPCSVARLPMASQTHDSLFSKSGTSSV